MYLFIYTYPFSNYILNVFYFYIILVKLHLKFVFIYFLSKPPQINSKMYCYHFCQITSNIGCLALPDHLNCSIHYFYLTIFKLHLEYVCIYVCLTLVKLNLFFIYFYLTLVNLHLKFTIIFFI